MYDVYEAFCKEGVVRGEFIRAEIEGIGVAKKDYVLKQKWTRIRISTRKKAHWQKRLAPS